VKKYGSLLLLLSIVILSLGLNSCKKINEATELGGDLIPAVDNIHTFESFYTVETDNQLYSDSSKLTYSDGVALGAITNDPEFGQTQASVYFNLAPSGFGAYPFYNKDSIVNGSVDSVILSLSYLTTYGDTNSTLNVHVFEIDPTANFRDTIESEGLYSVHVSDFPTTGPELGAKSFQPRSLTDSIRIIRQPGDTVKVNNILRIKFNSTAFASKFINDTAMFGATATYRSAVNFYKIFKGLAIKADMQGNALAYFNLADVSKTALTFYYRVHKNGVIDTTTVSFIHGDQRTASSGTDSSKLTRFGAQANVIRRTPANGWATYLANAGTNDNKLYLQSDPGSAGIIKIPSLDTLKGRIIYRAELILPRLSAQGADMFPPPTALFLDKLYPGDTAYSIADDLISMNQQTGSINFSSFGGMIKGDSTYRFNITRHVQGIVTHAEPNTKLRVYIPYQDMIYFSPNDKNKPKRIVNALPLLADGRIILGGGSFVNPERRTRLRVVYSNVQ
jgi:hypothetical protein